MTDLVKIENLYFKFPNQFKSILKDVSFTIDQKDFLTIVGPSGAGKTTLLKLIIGLLKPSNGEITLKNDISFGYVPQKIQLNTSIPITVREFLKLNFKSDNASIERVISEIKIKPLIDITIHNLSGGEMQKVLLANALLNQPNLLILDEPAQNLDLSSQIQFYELIQNIYKKNNLAILMVSHDIHMVMSATQKVICLYNHICCQGQPESITKHPEFKKIFGEDMRKLMTIYNHYHNHKHD
ncbi:MAG: ATP-binding cassette domain-containing protein [Rickettsiales bacterium]|nr:ATP-binding cassette domain-containing protein [Rickettsiales bacterium]